MLKALNPGADFDKAGQSIQVPNVITMPPGAAARVEVSKSESSVRAYDADNQLLAFYVATIGSEHDPLPIGDWKIRGVAHNPVFHYNPELFWDAKATDEKATIKPGPNNPVGVVWIDLSKEHYGIHGTPEPSRDRAYHVARLHPADKLGRGGTGVHGQAGRAGHSEGVTSYAWKSSRRVCGGICDRRVVLGAGCGAPGGCRRRTLPPWQRSTVRREPPPRRPSRTRAPRRSCRVRRCRRPETRPLRRDGSRPTAVGDRAADRFRQRSVRAAELHLAMPLAGVDPKTLTDTFNDARTGHKHEALDIMAPRGTPVLAVAEGNVAKLFNSKQGGLTVYQFDNSQQYAFYYAHSTATRPDLKEGMLLRKGDTLGLCRARPAMRRQDAPHLHFAVFQLGPEKNWWKGTALDPLPMLRSEQPTRPARARRSRISRAATAGRAG